MLADMKVHRQVLTRAQWLKTLSTFRRYDWTRQRNRDRRGPPRYQISGSATLTFQAVGSTGGPTVYPRCSVLDASNDGMGIRCYRAIAVGTAVSLDLHVGTLTFNVSGHVRHSTGTPGAVRVGVRLEFDAAADGSVTPT
jgi:hypothetical protein